MGERRRVTACTIVARNYLPAARVLAASYLEQHPDHRFVIEVIDADPATGETANGALVVGPSWLAIDRTDYLRMATAYSVTELATAVKPYLLLALRADSDVVVYLDPDIRVYAPFPEIAELALAHPVVLTPHVLEPMPRDGKKPDEAVIMGTGIFNLGFVACGPGAEPFLRFWAQRLRHDAIKAPEQQLFTDQRWVDQVPALFDHAVHRDPACNVAYWNAHERPLRGGSSAVRMAGSGEPLKFFHFSGYRPEQPWILSYHCVRKPRVVLSEHPVLRELCDDYAAELRAAGYAERIESVPYGFGTLPDGTRVSVTMRRLFRAAWIDAEAEGSEVPPHAFDGTGAFERWLARPQDRPQRASGLNRLLMSAWAGRPDLQRAFPRPYAQHAAAYRLWCTRSGVTELDLPAWALPAVPAAPETEVDETFGVNLLGYLTAELGNGEMARLLHDAVREAEIPVAAIVEDKAVLNRTGVDRPVTEAAARYGVSLLCVNADQTQLMAEVHPDVLRDRYRVGFWAWELEEFPEWMHSAFDLVDEIWTVSEFCARAIARHTSLPVKVFPAPVRDVPPVRERERAGRTRFLFAFDFNSVAERKNPWGVVDAFRRAFGDRTDVRLVLKAINGDRHPVDAERLRMAVLGDDRIELLERYLSADELDRLYRDSDCYVSLHRSEGFGLTVAQAMALGIPVISTDYSATAEYLDEKTGWPVPYSMTTVGPGCFPYHEDAVWAAPDERAAADAMRRVADDPGEAAARAATAREHMVREHSMAAAAAWVARQLREAHETWLARRAPEPAAEPMPDPLDPLRRSAEALRWRADPGASARNPVAPAVRRAVLRALDHYDVHQREVLATLVDGGDATARLLRQRIEWLESRLDAVTTQLSETTERTARVDERAAVLEHSHDELRHRAPGTELALRNVERDVAELADTADAQSARLDDVRRELHRELTERDRRSDGDEQQLGDLSRQWATVADAARLRHAPLPSGTEVVLCDAGALLLPVDKVILPWLVQHRSWEAAESALIASLMRDGAFLDVGAHVGYHSLALLRRLGGVARIVAVEADPRNAELLRRNVSVNVPDAGRRLVTVVEAAAWDSETTLRIGRVEPDNSGDVRVRPGPADTGTGTVPAVRLDSHPAATGGRVDVVKTDLQGRDHRAFAGLAGILDRDRPHLVVEFSPAAIEELGDEPAAALRAYTAGGYTPVPVGEDGPEAAEPAVDDLCARARATEAGLLTLWLRPD